MTTKSINDQVRAIKNATEKASGSKEAAVSFLRQAGIIHQSVSTSTKNTSKKK